MAARAKAEVRRFLDEPARRAQLRSKLRTPWYRHRFHSFGVGTVLDSPAWVYGPQKISIGDNVLILRNTWLSVELPAWASPEPALVIGDGAGIRMGCTISASVSITIEPYVIIGAGCSVVDSDHTHAPASSHAEPGWHESVLYNPSPAAPITIGRGSWLADRVAVLAGSRIGAHCSIGANSVVRGEIPDYSIAVGAPARVVGTTRVD